MSSNGQRLFYRFTVEDRCEARLRAGHVWVYASDIQSINAPEPAPEGANIPALENGMLCDVLSRRGRYLGTGFYNEHSKIRIRIVSNNANDRFDAAFWERRIRYAVAYRQTVMAESGDFEACRLIYGEADGFPGLTVDRFGDVLVTETLSLGIEVRKDLIFPLLVRVLAEYGVTVREIYERNEAPVRALEGLTPGKGTYAAEGLTPSHTGETEICENGIYYTVDYINGQKTGFFLDQKYNRRAAARLARGKRVLDCFTHTGSFALNAAAAGAEHVDAVDISRDAVDMTRRNAERNGLADRMSFICTDVFAYLDALYEKKAHPYDMIILDPPAFTKSAGTADKAYAGYREINRKAMKLLPRGGYLATASCSHFMPSERFETMLREAAYDASVTLKLIEARKQAPDHPILWSVPETDYLKFYLLQVT